MDRTGLLKAETFRLMIANHRQVERIVRSHHHRAIVGQCAQAITSLSPSIAHQVAPTRGPSASGGFNVEPPAFRLRLRHERAGFVTCKAYMDLYAGPFCLLPTWHILACVRAK